MATVFLHSPILQRSEVRETDMHTARFFARRYREREVGGDVWYDSGSYTC